MVKLIWEPKIYPVGMSSTSGFENDHVQEYLYDYGMSWEPSDDDDPHYITEVAGRVCYLSFGKGRNNNKDYMDNIIESKHGSVLEHVVFNFIVAGVSRSFSHELVRHRAGMAYSQLSQRYVDESECAFVVPPDLIIEPNSTDQGSFEYASYVSWVGSMEQALHAYTQLTEYLTYKFQDLEDRTERRKRARQTARAVLPNSTETHIFVSGNKIGRAHV